MGKVKEDQQWAERQIKDAPAVVVMIALIDAMAIGMYFIDPGSFVVVCVILGLTLFGAVDEAIKTIRARRIVRAAQDPRP